jgi:hypothetical protein
MSDDEVERLADEMKRKHAGVTPINLHITEDELRNNSEQSLFELIARRLNEARKQIRERDARNGG